MDHDLRRRRLEATLLNKNPNYLIRRCVCQPKSSTVRKEAERLILDVSSVADDKHGVCIAQCTLGGLPDFDVLTFILTGHLKYVSSMSWSPDGSRLASGSGDHTIHIWHADTGDTISTLEGHFDMIRSVIWSPDGNQLASGSCDKTVLIWDVITGAVACLKGTLVASSL